MKRGDHPRIRGEHAALDVEGLAALGSSPHTRGARDDVVVRLVHIGIIPAYAGSTPTPWSRVSSATDHPRIRGEHLLTCRFILLLAWIIPAYAGSTTC